MRYTYCPRCGQQLGEKELGDEGMVPWCGRCERPVWEAFTTAVIAAVVNEDDEVALLRQGYISAEIGEELGLAVKELAYMGSWPHKNGDMLMLGFCAVVEKGAFTLSREVDAARWAPFDGALPLIREGSIAQQLVRASIALGWGEKKEDIR